MVNGLENDADGGLGASELSALSEEALGAKIAELKTAAVVDGAALRKLFAEQRRRIVTDSGPDVPNAQLSSTFSRAGLDEYVRLLPELKAGTSGLGAEEQRSALLRVKARMVFGEELEAPAVTAGR